MIILRLSILDIANGTKSYIVLFQWPLFCKEISSLSYSESLHVRKGLYKELKGSMEELSKSHF